MGKSARERERERNRCLNQDARCTYRFAGMTGMMKRAAGGERSVVEGSECNGMTRGLLRDSSRNNA